MGMTEDGTCVLIFSSFLLFFFFVSPATRKNAWPSNNLTSRSLWRNRLARSAVNRKVGGSSPPGDVSFCFANSVKQFIARSLSTTFVFKFSKVVTLNHKILGVIFWSKVNDFFSISKKIWFLNFSQNSNFLWEY